MPAAADVKDRNVHGEAGYGPPLLVLPQLVWPRSPAVEGREDSADKTQVRRAARTIAQRAADSPQTPLTHLL